MAASPAGFDAMAGYADADGQDGAAGRRDAEGRQGDRVWAAGHQAGTAYTIASATFSPTLQRPRDQILVNDEIIAVNDAPVVDFDSLILAVNAYSAGDTVRLKIRRGDETIERTIVLAKYPVDGEVIVTNRPKPWRGPARRLHEHAQLPALRPRLARCRAAGRRRDRGRGRVAGRRRRDQERPVDPQGRTTRPCAPPRLRRGRRHAGGPRHAPDRPGPRHREMNEVAACRSHARRSKCRSELFSRLTENHGPCARLLDSS